MFIILEVQGYRCDSDIVITLEVCKINIGTEETAHGGFVHGKLEVLVKGQVNFLLEYVL